MAKYEQFIREGKNVWGKKFSAASLAKKFISAYNHGQRIRVRFSSGEVLSGKHKNNYRPEADISSYAYQIGPCTASGPCTVKIRSYQTRHQSGGTDKMVTLADKLGRKNFTIMTGSGRRRRVMTPKELARKHDVSENYLKREMSRVLDLGWTGREWF